MIRLERYISEREISKPRKPEEFIRWFEAKLKITKKQRGELKKQNLLHEGIAKIFYEELFPLYRLLQHKEKEWHDVEIMHVSGNQNYDIKVISGRKSIPKFIEITSADMNYDEYLRMKYFVKHSSVNALGRVSKEGTKRTGLMIYVEDEAKEHSELNLEKKEQILIAIKKKLKDTKRPNNTALLIDFNDYIAFSRGKDKKEMNDFLDSAYMLWKDRFVNLFIVGASGKGFWERLKK